MLDQATDGYFLAAQVLYVLLDWNWFLLYVLPVKTAFVTGKG